MDEINFSLISNNPYMKTKKGQLPIEVLIILIFLLILFFFGGLYQRAELAVSESTDFNDIVLARETIDTLKNTINLVGLGGNWARKDIMVHIPFNTVDINCAGNKINMTVLLYEEKNCTPLYKGLYCYVNLSAYTEYNISECQLCDPTHKQNREFWSGVQFCCDAGFNMNLKIEKDGDNVTVRQRRYWSITNWIL
jgi:uncharacterized protein (UPF0333 family)